MIEIESLEAFDTWVSEHASLSGLVLQGIDLTERTEILMSLEVSGAVFLGCLVSPVVQERLHHGHALAFPPFHELPFNAFRSQLYSAEELFDGYEPGKPQTFDLALDTRVYQWHMEQKERHDVVDALAERIHDHAIDDALRHALENEGRHDRVVAIMGGHGMVRDEPAYRDVALLSRRLTREGYICASGGGPGAMEATNFGAWMSTHPDEALDAALAMLSEAAKFEPMHDWLDTALAVRERWPLPEGLFSSLGIPTWHYGHEPPNVFASHIAKYFANSIREEGLLAIARSGVVFSPGSAGTIQEIFQDAAQNHYESFGISPMVFMNTEYWTITKPVYPVLKGLAQGKAYADHLAIYDSVDDIVDHLMKSIT